MQGNAFLRRTQFCAKFVYFLALGCLCLFLALISLLRFWILPHINDYRAEIAHFIAQSTGIHLTIEKIEADWETLRPRLALNRLTLFDPQHRPALVLNMATELDWWMLASGQVSLSSLSLSQPKLLIKREKTGQIFVAGIPISQQSTPTDSKLVNWLLAQPKMYIEEGEIIWEDALQQKPPLYLSHCAFSLEKTLFSARHTVNFHAQLLQNKAAKLTLTGHFDARSLSDLQKLTGTFETDLSIQNIALISQHITLPFQLQQGQGQLASTMQWHQGQLQSVETDLNIQHLKIQTAPEHILPLRRVSGQFRVTRHADRNTTRWQVEAKNAAAYFEQDQDNLLPSQLNTFIEFKPDSFTLNQIQGTVSEWNVQTLSKLRPYLPISTEHKNLLQSLAPSGLFSEIEWQWAHTASSPRFQIKAYFDNLTIQPFEKMPGIAHLYGFFQTTQESGQVQLKTKAGQQVVLNYPAMFETPLEAKNLQTTMKWQKTKEGEFELRVPNLFLSNAHAEGTMQMLYRTQKGTPGYLDLSARLTRAEGRAVHYYLPKVIMPAVRTWVKNAILGGKSHDVRFKVQGHLKEFPFIDNKNGIFEVNAAVQNGQLEFYPGWQKITDIQANLLFSGKKMLIQAQRGVLHQTQLSQVKAFIPDLIEPKERLYVTGQAEGKTAAFLDYIVKTPVSAMISHATKEMVAQSGQTKLQLDLFIPLREVEKTRVKGDVTLMNTRAQLQPNLPLLEHINGQLQFTEKGLFLKPITATAFGGSVAVTQGQFVNPTTFVFYLEGKTNLRTFLSQQKLVTLDPMLTQLGKQYLEGQSPWKAAVTLDTQKNQTYLTFTSPLTGIESKLPLPLNKKSSENMPLKIEWLPTAMGEQYNNLNVLVGSEVALNFLYNQKFDKIERGLIQVGEDNKKSNMPSNGVWVSVQKKQLNVTPWFDLMNDLDGGNAAKNNKKEGSKNAFPLLGGDIKTDLLTIGPKRFRDVHLIIKSPSKNLYQVNINAREAKGDIFWSQQGQNKRLSARFKYFNTPDDIISSAIEKQQNAANADETLPQDFPSLDVVIDQFTIKNKKFGKFELLASPQGKNWQIDKLTLALPEGKFSLKGIWYGWLSHHQSTRATIEVETTDVGKLLSHLGQPNTIKRGTATLSGQLTWQGKPSALNTQTMHGNVTLEAKNGQFLKAEPGIGKLLGVLSLQALPRRITLDFKDIFSEGFSFDTVTAHARIDNGILSSQDFLMSGSVAQVTMKGDVNLNQETQKLRVRVMPSLTDGMTLLSFLGGPVTGVTSYIIQKILRNPVEQMIPFEYNITGGWSNPKVEKVGLTPPATTNSSN